jgi:hypothetical protein
MTVLSLVPSSEETAWAQGGAGAVVLAINLRAMVPTDSLIVRHYVDFPVDGLTVIGSKTLTHGDTDDTWSGTLGGTDALGWQTWPFIFDGPGGNITFESLSGSYDVEFFAHTIWAPTG